MKKVFLLLAVGSLAMNVQAQELQKKSVLFGANANQPATTQALGIPEHTSNLSLHSALTSHSATERTTTGGGRWYDYASDYLFNSWGSNFQTTSWNLWQDTTAWTGYMNAGVPTYYQNKWKSLGFSLDPFFSSLNDPSLYPAVIAITSTDGYTIDSVSVDGWYLRNPAKGTITDHIRIALIYGDGSGTSDMGTYYFTGMTSSYGLDTVRFLGLGYDSIPNEAKGTTRVTYDFPLTSADTNSFLMTRKFAVNLAVPPGNAVGVTYSFVSGDTHPWAGDTIEMADGTVKYNEFYGCIAYNGTSTTTSFAPYTAGNYNTGYSKVGGYQGSTNGWNADYFPHWTWSSSGGGAYPMQYPVIGLHASCSSCGLTSFVGVKNVTQAINAVSVTPNPASDVVNVSFTLSQQSNATVSLTNMIGQVVASQNFSNVQNAKAQFNTASLPSGVYVYSLQAGNMTKTGRIVVAH